MQLPLIATNDGCLLFEHLDTTIGTTIVVTNTNNRIAMDSILHLDAGKSCLKLFLLKTHA